MDELINKFVMDEDIFNECSFYDNIVKQIEHDGVDASILEECDLDLNIFAQMFDESIFDDCSSCDSRVEDSKVDESADDKRNIDENDIPISSEVTIGAKPPQLRYMK